ncbi:HoxN/HupN/NixA family nickel/cobalt transporter, partial [Pseudomonas gingeri]|nr:HoxN/HupN/NixA family nickel/cobalt transporter [Pseudomonas gingeri]
VVIGSIEALGLIGDQLDLKGAFWGVIGALNDSFGMLGYMIIGIFVASWAISVMLYRLKGFDRVDVKAG